MKPNVNPKVIYQTFDFLGCTPRFSKESIDIGSEHGAGVVQGKQRIESKFLELALPRDRTSSTRVTDVFCHGKVFV